MFWLRLAGALFLLVLGIFAVVRVPHGILWKPAVVATAFGVWLLPFAALVTWSGERADLPAWLSLVGATLLISPLLRALPVAQEARSTVEAAFGTTPWTGEGLAPRSAPYTLLGLLGPGSSGPAPEPVPYGDNGLVMALYRGAGPGPHPVVIAIHGGSWNAGDPSQLPAAYRYLAARGLTVAAVTYRYAPEHRFPAQRDDITDAIRHLRANAESLDTDPERTVLLGRSAGGHLALLAGYTTDDPGIRGVVALYPPTDLNWSWEHPSNPLVLDSVQTLSDFLGGPRDQVPDAFDAASPIRFVDASTPPTLLIHGSRDELVFAEQSRRLARRLGDAGVAHALVETPWDTHGLDANLGGPGGQLYLWSVERFLGSVLGRP